MNKHTLDLSDKPYRDGRAKEGRRRQERSRAAILDAATTLFTDKGFHQTTINDIIEDAGISRATMYNNFPSKAHVLTALLDRFIEKLGEVIRPIRTGKGNEVAQLIANVERTVDAFEENKALGRLVVLGPVDAGETEVVVRGFNNSIEQMIVRALRIGIEQGMLRKVDIETGARCILGSVREAILMPLVRGELSAGEAKIHVVNMVDYHLRGLWNVDY